jgi:phospholipid/cholesterol/gamma-HCH transport system permease protein
MQYRFRALSLPERLWNALSAWALAWCSIIFMAATAMVLTLTPSSYSRTNRKILARQIYMGTAPILLGFTALAALISLVLTRIVVVTALSYGLSGYALEMLIRVLVVELIPLTAALFVAMRCSIPNGALLAFLQQTGHFDDLRSQGIDPLRAELVPRVVAGVFACVTLAALSCVVALVLAYSGVYGLNLAGLPSYTRMFGQVFSPGVTLVFVLKTMLFSLAVGLIPLASALQKPAAVSRQNSALMSVSQGGNTQSGGLSRMFAVLVLIEMVSLMGNYY